MANQAALNQAGQFGAQASNTQTLANQAALNQASQFGASAFNQAQAQQAAQLQAARQFGASAQNQAGLANQAAANQMSQFNVGNQLQAALANQQAGLQFNQQRVGAAGQLGTLANLGFGMGQQLQSGMSQQGALQQAMQQRIIDAARQQYTGYQQQPATSLGYLATALGMGPSPQTQSTSNQMGMTDYAATAAALMSIFSDENLKTDISKVGKTPGGHNIYKWNWNEKAKELGLSGSSTGVIAQEVQKVIPEAVHKVNGYLAVNYGMIK
jgi:hypothetical protein